MGLWGFGGRSKPLRTKPRIADPTILPRSDVLDLMGSYMSHSHSTLRYTEVPDRTTRAAASCRRHLGKDKKDMQQEQKQEQEEEEEQQQQQQRQYYHQVRT